MNEEFHLEVRNPDWIQFAHIVAGQKPARIFSPTKGWDRCIRVELDRLNYLRIRPSQRHNSNDTAAETTANQLWSLMIEVLCSLCCDSNKFFIWTNLECHNSSFLQGNGSYLIPLLWLLLATIISLLCKLSLGRESCWYSADAISIHIEERGKLTHWCSRRPNASEKQLCTYTIGKQY